MRSVMCISIEAFLYAFTVKPWLIDVPFNGATAQFCLNCTFASSASSSVDLHRANDRPRT